MAGSLMNPESDVLAFGVYGTTTTEPGPLLHTDNGNTKTMRKLQAGDKLVVSAANQVSATGTLAFIIQYFALA